MGPNHILRLIKSMDDELTHYSSDYYDPAKAHEYYMQNRNLKGRTTSGLSEEGKEVWTSTKANIASEKKTKVMEANLEKEVELQNARSKAETTRLAITNKLKDLSEKLIAKYKTDTEGLSESQKEQLEVIARKRKKEQEQIRETKENKIDKINEDDDLSAEEKKG